MRKIISRREVAADAWRYPGEAGEGRQLVPLAEAVAAGDALPAGSGVVVAPGEEVDALAPLLERVALVVLRFEKPGEGRGYSLAQLLRRRFGYAGTVRAAGPTVKVDQLFLLARCGCDEFELHEGEDPARALAHLDRYSVAHQPAVDRLVSPRQR